MVENKGLSLALHYRAAPEREEAARRVVAEPVAAAGAAFQVQEGKMVLEIRPVGANKGDAVDAFMAEPPFAGRWPAWGHTCTTLALDRVLDLEIRPTKRRETCPPGRSNAQVLFDADLCYRSADRTKSSGKCRLLVAGVRSRLRANVARCQDINGSKRARSG